MQTAHLLRLNPSDEGTFGRIILANGDIGPQTLELPWRDNERNISCIPLGRYLCHWYKSATWGWVYSIESVPQRGQIRIHWGNYAGDITKGWKTDSAGCILLGERQGELRGQKVILNSRTTTIDFFRQMRRDDFILNIIDLKEKM